MRITDRDRQLLRGLAAQVAELADAPEQHAPRELWRKHNDLQTEKIMVSAHIHDAWPEFFSLEVAEDPMLRQWEWSGCCVTRSRWRAWDRTRWLPNTS